MLLIRGPARRSPYTLPLCRRDAVLQPSFNRPRMYGPRRRRSALDHEVRCRLRRLTAWLIVTRSQKITFAELRDMGVNEVLVYCADYKCTLHIRLNADRWPGHLRLSDIEDRFVCQVCGKHSADIRPKFPQAEVGTG
jgi:hypothetical protein